MFSTINTAIINAFEIRMKKRNHFKTKISPDPVNAIVVHQVESDFASRFTKPLTVAVNGHSRYVEKWKQKIFCQS